MAKDEYPIYDVKKWVLNDVLRFQAARRGNKTCVKMVTGESFTYSKANHVANQIAQLLKKTGVQKGDNVAVMLNSNIDYCYAWFGINRLGAVHVAVHVDYKYSFLSHVLNNSMAKVVICHPDYLENLKNIEKDLKYLKKIIVTGKPGKMSFKKMKCFSFDEYHKYDGIDPKIDVSYQDTACIMYTSGTTGASKGVLMPHAHIYLFGLGIIENMLLTKDDTYYIVLPLYHANAMFMQLYATLIMGASAIVRDRFSAKQWIPDIIEHNATITNTLGVVNSFILNQPPSKKDKNHNLRAIGVAPNPPDLDMHLRSRFGIKEVIGMYGMTEVNIPLYTKIGAARPGSCGKVWDRFFELKIVDPDTDEDVPPNEIGEIVVRPRQPFGFMTGYNNEPEKTIEAWRNFWFHTGDAAKMDEEGYVYFVDRIKDCIRRRGENISSFEVEAVLNKHEAIAETAAVAVRLSELEEDEIVLFIVLKEGKNISPEELIEYCEIYMPRFAVPRFIEFVEELPKTPTEKVRKKVLRERGLSNITWDKLVPHQD